MRGTAAIIVLLFHAAIVFDEPTLFSKGWLAVDFFFALSGYVMARTYEERMKDDWRAFLRLRFWRLWPLMLIGGALGLPLLYKTLGWWAAPVALLNVLFVPTFYKRDNFPLNGPYWSLFYELFANIAHALVLSRLSSRWLGLALTALTLILIYFCIANDGLSLGTSPKTFWPGFVRVLVPYTIGLLLYRVWHDAPPIRVSAVLTPVALPLGIFGAGLLPGWLPELAFAICGTPLLIIGGISMPAGELGRWLGRISFPLYAVHYPVLRLLHEAGASEGWGIIAAVAMAAGIAETMTRVSRYAGSRLQLS